MKKLNSYKCLVLNADYQPLSLYPLSTISWQSAIRLSYLDRVVVVSHHDRVVHSPSTKLEIPSVIALKDYVHQDKRSPAFSKPNVFLRDGYRCVYCGHDDDLTYDHVIPRKLGGLTNWENISTACMSCNLDKGSKTLEEWGQKPSIKPYRPTIYDLMKNKDTISLENVHESWLDYIFWQESEVIEVDFKNKDVA